MVEFIDTVTDPDRVDPRDSNASPPETTRTDSSRCPQPDRRPMTRTTMAPRQRPGRWCRRWSRYAQTRGSTMGVVLNRCRDSINRTTPVRDRIARDWLTARLLNDARYEDGGVVRGGDVVVA